MFRVQGVGSDVLRQNDIKTLRTDSEQRLHEPAITTAIAITSITNILSH